jgi:hypothetical protein
MRSVSLPDGFRPGLHRNSFDSAIRFYEQVGVTLQHLSRYRMLLPQGSLNETQRTLIKLLGGSMPSLLGEFLAPNHKAARRSSLLLTSSYDHIASPASTDNSVLRVLARCLPQTTQVDFFPRRPMHILRRAGDESIQEEPWFLSGAGRCRISALLNPNFLPLSSKADKKRKLQPVYELHERMPFLSRRASEFGGNGSLIVAFSRLSPANRSSSDPRKKAALLTFPPGASRI